ncbi:MAG: RHS repeat domain-containing protein, partial [Acidimicrobiales bacterium]
MTKVADPDATLTFTYDSGGRRAAAATSGPAGQPTVTLTYGHDGADDRTTVTDGLASAGVTTYRYDAALRPTTIARSLGGTAGPQVALGHDPADRLTSIARTIGGAGTAVTTTLAYDAADRLTTITHQVAGGPVLATYAYGHDAANRVSSEQDAEGTATFTYDDAGQLTAVGGARTESYGYDSGGNRDTTGYTTVAGNELTAAPGYTYTYDAEGNMTARTATASGDVTTFAYDYHNRLTGATEKTSGGSLLMQATYTYDPTGRRIGTDVGGTQTWTAYDGQDPYADFSGSGTLQERYLYGPAVDEVLARTDPGGTTAWYLTDRLGSVRDLAGTAGGVIDHVVYDSFGQVTSETNAANGDRFKFAGMRLDRGTGLYNDNAREYDPGGRFTTRDPSGFAAGDADLYRYAGNAPTDATDPTGLEVYLRPGKPWKLGTPWTVGIHYSVYVWDPVNKTGVKYDGGGQGSSGATGTGSGAVIPHYRPLGPTEGPRDGDILITGKGTYDEQHEALRQ